MGLCGSSEPAKAPAVTSKGGSGEDGKASAQSEAEKPLGAAATKERSKSTSGRMAEAPGMDKPAPLLKQMSEHLEEQGSRNSLYGTSRPHKLMLVRDDVAKDRTTSQGQILKKISSRLGTEQSSQGSMSAAATFETKGADEKKKYLRKKRKLSIALADHIHDQNEEAYVQHSVNIKSKKSGKLDNLIKGSLASKLQEEVAAGVKRRPSELLAPEASLAVGSAGRRGGWGGIQDPIVWVCVLWSSVSDKLHTLPTRAMMQALNFLMASQAASREAVSLGTRSSRPSRKIGQMKSSARGRREPSLGMAFTTAVECEFDEID